MATIRKRGARWQVQVRRQGIQCISKSFLLRADAEAWGRQKEVELDRGEFVWQTNANPKMTVGDLLTRYLTEITPAKRGNVPEAARIKTMLKTELAATRLKLLKSAHIASYRDQRLTKVTKGSVRRELAILQHCIIIALREWQLIATNPMAGVTKPADNPSRSRRPSEAELQAIAVSLLCVRNPVIRQVFQFALATGMRRGEVLSLEWQHVHWQNKTAFLPMTKNGERRTVPLSPQALDVLGHRARENTHDRAKDITQLSGPVFPITANAMRLAWERMRTRAKIKDLRFHDLRHEAISRFFEMGLSVPEVALISGHKDKRMLFRYTHLRADDIAQKIASISRKEE